MHKIAQLIFGCIEEAVEEEEEDVELKFMQMHICNNIVLAIIWPDKM